MSRCTKLLGALIVSLALLAPAGSMAATKTAHKMVKKTMHKGHRAKGWGRKSHRVTVTRHKGHRMAKARRMRKSHKMMVKPK